MQKTNQEAVITTSLAPAHRAAAPTPVQVPTHMPHDRMLAFGKTVADRIREGVAQGMMQSAVIAAMLAEQAALARTLAQPSFIHQLATGYAQEMATLQSPIPHEEAMREAASILKNRVADCQGFVALLGQPAFLAMAQTQAAQPATAPQPYALSPRKIEETIRRMVQPNDPAGAEPAVHVAATARGQQVTHQALANVFRPSGVLRAPLVHALASAWPQATGAQLEQMAATWLKARHDPAHSVANGLKPAGAIYVEAMRRAEVLQAQKLTMATPASATVAPRVHAGVVQTPPHDLLMDAV